MSYEKRWIMQCITPALFIVSEPWTSFQGQTSSLYRFCIFNLNYHFMTQELLDSKPELQINLISHSFLFYSPDCTLHNEMKRPRQYIMSFILFGTNRPCPLSTHPTINNWAHSLCPSPHQIRMVSVLVNYIVPDISET